jgi:hypothetical protein
LATGLAVTTVAIKSHDSGLEKTIFAAHDGKMKIFFDNSKKKK